MLSQETIQVIKSTVPVLEIHGTAITKRFYEMMFNGHPELLHIFNHANQKQGRQQTALANAVYAAAANIDQLEAILPAVKQIAHKHRSIGVKPEQYPIVGHYLLAAIKDVLGEAATEDILRAWKEAYDVIADVFIQVESEMYEQAASQPGGWKGFREFKVDRKVKENEWITSFYLVPLDGKGLADFEPGQYVSVKLVIPGERYTHIRQYSLSDAPGKPYYRISVKREDAVGEKPAGIASVYLHDKVQVGDVLPLAAPAGSFVLDRQDPRPAILISGGVGLTPMVSMLETLAETCPERQVIYVHATRTGSTPAMKARLEAIENQHPQVSLCWCEGDLDPEWLRQRIPTLDAGFYFCGPIPFMKTVNQALLNGGVPAADIHYEFFGPAGSLVDANEPAPEKPEQPSVR
ncbi:NO-inducible flavohemoprotein [Paenibacillus senegalensis]|uniref:NO-inducible flavohemoprotein n=1 Tax=Paenibacillus senegalensis TaxID=1465766 RepID=UPI000289034B|nr:NO-inducible flavohemoprotein [Paenibacillus senegalensis]